jgi:glycine cleavage system H protein
MEGFNYTNIFETKGIEYLAIIAFLLMIIPFWIFINRRTPVTSHLKGVLGTLSAGILKIPLGLFFSKNHTWTHLENSGNARIGLDDLLLHLTGEVELNNLKTNGDNVKRGDLIAELNKDGKKLKILSPVSGVIVSTNQLLSEEPDLLNDDPYGKGWIYRIRPSDWVSETSSYYLAEEAVAWSKKELDRFKDFIAFSIHHHSPEVSMVLLQDGGELNDKPLSELPAEVWNDFQETFLNKIVD